MLDLTALILTKNDEIHIEKCIKSLRGIAKRIVVVDSFSTDRTEEICSRLGVDFYQNPFIDFPTQVNWALNNTNINTKWTIRLDSDEELTEELVKEIESKLDSLSDDINGVILKRRLYFMDKWIRHGGVYPTSLLRIFRTGKAVMEQRIMDPHLVLIGGKTVTFKHDFIDNNKKGLEYWMIKHNWYSNMEVADYFRLKEQPTDEGMKPSLFGSQAQRKRWLKDRFYFAMPLMRRAKWYFIYRYIFRLGFLDGKEGLIYHFLQAYWYRFYVDAKIYECEKLNKRYSFQGGLKH